MTLALLVGLAAAVGAAARYLVDQVVQHQHDQTFPWGTFVINTFPWGTFVINTTGSLLLGLTLGLAADHGLPSVPTTLIGVGLLGGYTTWSTYLWESLALAGTGALVPATLNVVGSLAAGFAAAAAGFGLALL